MYLYIMLVNSAILIKLMYICQSVLFCGIKIYGIFQGFV
jgi:hypothetical protein